jgi:type II secretory pathway component PulJ
MGMEWASPTIAIVGFIASILVSAISATWALSKRFDAEKREVEAKMQAEHDALRDEFMEAMRSCRSECGETVRAIRTKVEQFEFWVRDNVLVKMHAIEIMATENKASNQAVREAVDRFADMMQNMDKKIDLRFTRVENKIDAAANHRGDN